MALFSVLSGGFDVEAFELADIVLGTVDSTATQITAVDGDTTWRFIGTDFDPVGAGVLPTSGLIDTTLRSSPDGSFVTASDTPTPLADFLAAIELNATDPFLDGLFAGADVLAGGAEADVLTAGGGPDTLIGGGGGDILDGEVGPDRLFGDRGPDTLIGGRGNDVMAGGRGADLFVFDPARAREGDDVVLDFNLAVDRVQLSAPDVVAATTDVDLADAITAEEIAAGMDASTLWGLGAGAAGEAQLSHPNGSVTLAGVAATALPVDSFTGLLEAGALVLADLPPVPDDGGAVA